jgi:hypothetical protein
MRFMHRNKGTRPLQAASDIGIFRALGALGGILAS